MKRLRPIRHPGASQRGISMVMVVVVISLFALVGAYMATMLTTSAASTSLTHGRMQGWFAAKSGSEWATWQVLHSGSGCAATSATLTVGAFSVTTSCAANAVSEGPDNYTVFSLVTRATRGTQGSADYISRQVRRSVTDAP